MGSWGFIVAVGSEPVSVDFGGAVCSCFELGGELLPADLLLVATSTFATGVESELFLGAAAPILVSWWQKTKGPASCVCLRQDFPVQGSVPFCNLKAVNKDDCFILFNSCWFRWIKAMHRTTAIRQRISSDETAIQVTVGTFLAGNHTCRCTECYVRKATFPAASTINDDPECTSRFRPVDLMCEQV